MRSSTPLASRPVVGDASMIAFSPSLNVSGSSRRHALEAAARRTHGEANVRLATETANARLLLGRTQQPRVRARSGNVWSPAAHSEAVVTTGDLAQANCVSFGAASLVQRQKPDVAFSDPACEVRLSAVACQLRRPDDVTLNREDPARPSWIECRATKKCFPPDTNSTRRLSGSQTG